MRRVVHFQHKRDPVEPSGFSYLPRDVAHLVLVNLAFHVLCGLKRVSRGVANACRRALCSEEFIDQDDNYNAMAEVIDTCAFSFPMRVYVEEADRRADSGFCVYEVDDPLVVHDFELEWLLDQRNVGVEDVCVWLYELMNMDSHDSVYEHFRRLRVKPVRFCIESARGVFHSERDLREHHGIEYSRETLSDYNPHTIHISGFELLELATRLVPYAIVGKRRFVSECDMLYDASEDRSLLHCMLCGRLCSK
jgi:hypothetical protein